MKKFQSTIKKGNIADGIVLILFGLGFSFVSMYSNGIDFINALVDVILNKPSSYFFVIQFLFYGISLYDTYLISENSVTIKFGGFIPIKRLGINHITKIFERKNYLIMEHNNSKYSISVSPKDKLGFVQSLKVLNPNIAIEIKELVQIEIQPAV